MTDTSRQALSIVDLGGRAEVIEPDPALINDLDPLKLLILKEEYEITAYNLCHKCGALGMLDICSMCARMKL